ncbi:hypothetical protein [Escherichia coli]|nr:hypothetical protein [Escherichia coli]EAN8226098.1 pili assembly chaperone [Salmonella enterica]EBU8508181.1 pili assembly chaperone [Salmonella enterica subsp. enterica serovar Agama]EDS5995131.1 pili assembly chaperone [Salmonella enterica subsp. enterica serovar Kisangani]EFW8817302.1 pili assembly chaperone [Shigella sonnei]EHF1623422.1 pili assembly chaperone [Salmonella enterica subsp. enterica serovar Enteritidis]MYO27594.1 pili assembly chaperone [Salmonella enterica subsp. enteri
MLFLVKLNIAIFIVFAITSALFWKIPKAFLVFLFCMYWVIVTAVYIESREQARIQYLESDINTLYLDSFKSKNNCKSFETNTNLLDKNGNPVEIMVCDDQELHFFVPKN